MLTPVAADSDLKAGNQPEATSDSARLEMLLKICSAILAIVSGLTAFLQLYLPGHLVWPITALLLLALIACFVAYLVIRHRETEKRSLKESPFGNHLIPYQEGESLPYREREGENLFSFVSARAPHLYLLTGLSGCGKTSLVRADLAARLARAGISMLYVSAESRNLVKAIRTACTRVLELHPSQTQERTLGGLLAETACHQRERFPAGLTLVCDQVEELFMPGQAGASGASWLGEIWEAVKESNPKIRVLFVIREAYRPLLMKLRTDTLGADAGDELDPLQGTFTLRHLQEDQARAFLRGSAFAEDVQDRIVTALAGEHGVAPAMLQLAGARLFDHQVFSPKAYRRVNGVAGALASYVEELVRDSADPETAWAMLRMLAESPVDLGSGTAPSQDQELMQAAAPGGLLDALVSARMLIVTPGGGVIVRDRNVREALHLALRQRQVPVLDGTRRLREYIALYENDTRVRLPWRTLLTVRRTASAWVLQSREARALLRASRRDHAFRLVTFAGALGLGVVVLGAAAIVLLGPQYATRAWYPIATVELRADGTHLNFQPTAMAVAPDGDMLVVAHNGHGLGLYTLDAIRTPWPLASQTSELKPIPDAAGTEYTALAFGPKGKSFASGGRDGTIRLWDRERLKPDDTLKNPLASSTPERRSITYLGYTSDGQYLLGIDESKRVLLWNVWQRELARPPLALTGVLAPDDGIVDVSMREDGSRIAVMTAPNGEADKARVVVLRVNGTQIDVEGTFEYPNGTLLSVCVTDAEHLIVATKQGDSVVLESVSVDGERSIGVDPLDIRLGRPAKLVLARSGKTVGANLAEPLAWLILKRDGDNETKRSVVMRDRHPPLHKHAMSSKEQTLVLVDGEAGTTVYRWTAGYADRPIPWHE